METVIVTVMRTFGHQGVSSVQALRSAACSLFGQRKWWVGNEYMCAIWMKINKTNQKEHGQIFCCCKYHFCSACFVHFNSWLSNTCFPGMQHICTPHTLCHWHTANTKTGVYYGALTKTWTSCAPLNPSCHTDASKQQHCFHNRWQEAAVPSASSNWAFGSFIYYHLCPVSINHLHRSAFWLRCRIRLTSSQTTKLLIPD